MNGVVAITKKELRSFFWSPVAYVVIGIFLFIMGVIFAKFVQIYQQYNMAQRFGQAQGVTLDKLAFYLYQNMAFVLCFITPAITMKLFAEEKRHNTLELLFTAPIRGFELVVGKFCAAFCLMLLMALISFIYVFFMIIWGNPDIAIIGTTYLGLVLSMACYLSIGLLVSALTSSSALAFLWTFLALIMLWLLQSIGQGINARWGFIEWGPVLTYLSPLEHFSSFAQGVIHIKDLVYFLTFTIFVLFLTQRVVESNRWR